MIFTLRPHLWVISIDFPLPSLKIPTGAIDLFWVCREATKAAMLRLAAVLATGECVAMLLNIHTDGNIW